MQSVNLAVLSLPRVHFVKSIVQSLYIVILGLALLLGVKSPASCIAEAVKILEIETIALTKNHVNGTLITHTISFGSFALIAQVFFSPAKMFINAIATKRNAKIMYTILETSTQSWWSTGLSPNISPNTQSGVSSHPASMRSGVRSEKNTFVSPLRRLSIVFQMSSLSAGVDPGEVFVASSSACL